MARFNSRAPYSALVPFSRRKRRASGLISMLKHLSPRRLLTCFWRSALALILDQQIADLQKHVNSRLGDKCFSIEIRPETRRFLLEKGTSAEYGARELKRAIHRYLTQPLATLVIESKIQPGSAVYVSLGEGNNTLTFETTPM